MNYYVKLISLFLWYSINFYAAGRGAGELARIAAESGLEKYVPEVVKPSYTGTHQRMNPNMNRPQAIVNPKFMHDIVTRPTHQESPWTHQELYRPSTQVQFRDMHDEGHVFKPDVSAAEEQRINVNEPQQKKVTPSRSGGMLSRTQIGKGFIDLQRQQFAKNVQQPDISTSDLDVMQGNVLRMSDKKIQAIVDKVDFSKFSEEQGLLSRKPVVETQPKTLTVVQQQTARQALDDLAAKTHTQLVLHQQESLQQLEQFQIWLKDLQAEFAAKKIDIVSLEGSVRKQMLENQQQLFEELTQQFIQNKMTIEHIDSVLQQHTILTNAMMDDFYQQALSHVSQSQQQNFVEQQKSFVKTALQDITKDQIQQLDEFNGIKRDAVIDQEQTLRGMVNKELQEFQEQMWQEAQRLQQKHEQMRSAGKDSKPSEKPVDKVSQSSGRKIIKSTSDVSADLFVTPKLQQSTPEKRDEKDTMQQQADIIMENKKNITSYQKLSSNVDEKQLVTRKSLSDKKSENDQIYQELNKNAQETTAKLQTQVVADIVQKQQASISSEATDRSDITTQAQDEFEQFTKSMQQDKKMALKKQQEREEKEQADHDQQAAEQLKQNLQAVVSDETEQRSMVEQEKLDSVKDLMESFQKQMRELLQQLDQQKLSQEQVEKQSSALLQKIDTKMEQLLQDEVEARPKTTKYREELQDILNQSEDAMTKNLLEDMQITAKSKKSVQQKTEQQISKDAEQNKKDLLHKAGIVTQHNLAASSSLSQNKHNDNTMLEELVHRLHELFEKWLGSLDISAEHGHGHVDEHADTHDAKTHQLENDDQQAKDQQETKQQSYNDMSEQFDEIGMTIAKAMFAVGIFVVTETNIQLWINKYHADQDFDMQNQQNMNQLLHVVQKDLTQLQHDYQARLQELDAMRAASATMVKELQDQKITMISVSDLQSLLAKDKNLDAIVNSNNMSDKYYALGYLQGKMDSQ